MNEQHIHCIVNDCHYWSQGNRCSASEILVATDSFDEEQPDTVNSEMAAELSPQKAGSRMSTCCKTYIIKDSEKARVDGIKKMS
ncbi:MAG: DUF1540 domain-containing protein [Peptococcaceae bacterium]|jgi:hypothetical protein|nr:DUF1540 domain-containing protein [Peptococcaceae bacterium]MDH7525893.1 DUF1540 domain-containing protein [Peptococcaceae bacterium]